MKTRVAVLFLDLDHSRWSTIFLTRCWRLHPESPAQRLLGVVGTGHRGTAGGDEFTIVMEEVDELPAVGAMAEAVIAAFGEAILFMGTAMS